MLAQNVVNLGNENSIVYEQIQRYFEKLERRSPKTKESYERDIKDFFLMIKGKKLQELNFEDIQVNLEDTEDFIEILISQSDQEGNRKYANKTINGKITSLKGLIKYLSAKKLVKDVSFLSLTESLPEVTESYDALTVDEVLELAELASKERDKGEEKKLLLWFALDTSIRKSAILELKWSNFYETEFNYLIKGIDKGNKQFTRRISKVFYNELLKLKSESEYVFSLKKSTLDKVFKRVRNKMDFGDRKIVIHSIRKAGGSFFYNQTKDLDATRNYLGHVSPSTTVLYTSPNDYGATGAISIKDTIDKDLFKKVSHEEIIKAISMLDSGQKMLINKKIMELKE
ncbi:tyrosine-type recombinase/integrase [Bacillus sp. SCS-151]|uniref:tyrosine-type recombinase/integrase n=1 Tax=Nanhaiella sioensis TaxID=3115293 RepID=UPI003979DC27